VTGAPVRSWRRIAVAHGADGLVLDGGLEGRRIAGVLGSASHARWVLAQTDWEDSFALLEWLTSRYATRGLLARRLRAVIQQRIVSAPATPGQPAERRGVYEVLFATDPLRAAIHAGASAAKLEELARGDGFRTLGERIRAGVQSGALDVDDAARAMA
jgi:D-alanyl-D-alanine carboxypeptidase